MTGEIVHLAFTHVDCLRKQGDIALIIHLFKEWLCLKCFCSLCVFVCLYNLYECSHLPALLSVSCVEGCAACLASSAPSPSPSTWSTPSSSTWTWSTPSPSPSTWSTPSTLLTCGVVQHDVRGPNSLPWQTRASYVPVAAHDCGGEDRVAADDNNDDDELGKCANNQNGNLRWHLPGRGGGSRGGLVCH